jgi:hypothetical protein
LTAPAKKRQQDRHEIRRFIKLIFEAEVLMAAIRCALVIILVLVMTGLAQAQIVRRRNVPAGDATPEGGSFSIHFPIAFNDVEVSTQDPNTSAPATTLFMLTGADSDHIKFSATEASIEGLEVKPMEDFMSGVKQQPDAAVTDIRRETNGGQEILSFALNVPTGGYYFRVIRANSIQYMQVVQFPESARDKAIKMKDDFFGSFKIIARAPAAK